MIITAQNQDLLLSGVFDIRDGRTGKEREHDIISRKDLLQTARATSTLSSWSAKTKFPRKKNSGLRMALFQCDAANGY